MPVKIESISEIMVEIENTTYAALVQLCSI